MLPYILKYYSGLIHAYKKMKSYLSLATERIKYLVLLQIQNYSKCDHRPTSSTKREHIPFVPMGLRKGRIRSTLLRKLSYIR